MDEIDIEVVADPEVTGSPVLVEGLPGVGHVGKLAAEHVLEEYDDETTLVRRVYSEHFPPQVEVGEGGVTELTAAELHLVETEGKDVLVLTGDHQAQSNSGHYRTTDAFLDVAAEFGVERAFALGGVPTGELIEEYNVFGAATDDDLVDEISEYGVEFREDEPAGGIVGVSGLVLGLGERRGMEAVCLMGETSGYLVDPKSAQAVLEVLEESFGIELDYDSLNERAEEMEEVMNKIQEMEQQQSMDVPTDDDLRYIG